MKQVNTGEHSEGYMVSYSESKGVPSHKLIPQWQKVYTSLLTMLKTIDPKIEGDEYGDPTSVNLEFDGNDYNLSFWANSPRPRHPDSIFSIHGVVSREDEMAVDDSDSLVTKLKTHFEQFLD